MVLLSGSTFHRLSPISLPLSPMELHSCLCSPFSPLSRENQFNGIPRDTAPFLIPFWCPPKATALGSGQLLMETVLFSVADSEEQNGQVTRSSLDSSTVGIPVSYLTLDPESKTSLNVFLKTMYFGPLSRSHIPLVNMTESALQGHNDLGVTSRGYWTYF